MNRRDFLKWLGFMSMATVWPSPAQGAGGGYTLAGAAADGSPNVLIFVLDSFSAHHSPIYGYDRDTTPNLARLAERSTVFHRHYAAGGFTSPGTASLLTGSYPWSHRAFNVYGTVTEKFVQQNIFQAFGEAGYQRLGFAHTPFAAILLSQFLGEIDRHVRLEELSLFNDNFLSETLPQAQFPIAFPAELQYWVGSSDAVGGRFRPGSLFLSNLHRLWRVGNRKRLTAKYADLYPKGLPSTGNSILFLIEDAIDWIEKQVTEAHAPSATAPFMGYFHLYPPHFPYTPRREFAELFDDGQQPPQKPESFFSQKTGREELLSKRQNYDQYLTFADAELGRLLDNLETSGALENTIVVVTSDHGELFERGILGHVTQVLHEPLVHIPLLVSMPEQRERHDVYEPSSCVDVLPTLLNAIGAPKPAWSEGRLLPLNGASGEAVQPVFALEAKRNKKFEPLTQITAAMIEGDFKLTWYQGYEGLADHFTLHNVVADGEEMIEVSAENPALFKTMQDKLLQKITNADYLL